jgi:hypothetical protein
MCKHHLKIKFSREKIGGKILAGKINLVGKILAGKNIGGKIFSRKQFWRETILAGKK